MVKNALEILGLNAEEIKIYFELLETGAATAGEIAKRLAIVRPTVYNYLQKMTDKGVVERSLKFGVRSFSAQSPDRLDRLFEAKQKEIEQTRAKFKTQIPLLMDKFGKHNIAPKIKIFEGAKEIENVYDDILNHRNIDSFSIWPAANMLNHLSDEYWIRNNRERIRNNVKIYQIRTKTKQPEITKKPWATPCPQLLRYSRIAPESMDFEMGYWLYANKVAMLSSSAERYGFIIESAEMIGMLMAQWRFIWSVSKPYQPDTAKIGPWLDRFLKTI
jgi:predicted transcriptional regulator